MSRADQTERRVLPVGPWTIALHIVPAVALGLTLIRPPYIYYTLLRIGVTGAAAYLAYLFLLRRRNAIFGLGFAVIAILFNPVVPFWLGRTNWSLIDVATAGVFLIALLFEAGVRNLAARQGPEPQLDEE